MKNLLKKFRENKKGFTLAELLVVVAIVGILVAISIPVFTSQLAKARKATNQANMRAAKAAAVAQYLTDSKEGMVIFDYDLDKGVATLSASQTDATAGGLTKTEISEATDTKKYTDIRVTVKASTTSFDTSKGETTTNADGDVEIYVK